MMAVTHSVAAAAFGILTLNDLDPITVALLLVGSQLPDLDNTQSYIGRMFWPFARWIEERWPHRTITHSLWATLLVGLISSFPALFFHWTWKQWVALALGHFIAILTDTLTPEGVQLFWPSAIWAVCGSNPNARIRTGSKGELGILFGCGIFLCLSIWAVNTGGLKLWVGQLLGMRDSVTQAIFVDGENKHIYIDIEGFFLSDRQPVKKRFWLLEQEDKEFLIVDKQGVYKTGQMGQILTTKIVTVAGETAQIQVMNIDFSDEEILSKLQAFASHSPRSLIFLSGTLTVDSPEEVKTTIHPKQFPTLKVTGNQVQMNSCPIQNAIAKLQLQFGSGQLKAKVVYPPPNL